MRHLSRCVLNDLDAPADDLDDFQIALGEACANAVRYAAGSAGYTVTMSLADDVCEVEVTDLGPGFDGDAVAADGMPAGDSESGRGLFLMRALTDDLAFERIDGDGMRLRLVKRFPGLVVPG